MRWIGLLLLFIITASCTNEEIYYSYKNITIKRVDTDGKSTFYYLKNGKKIGKIWAEYSGITDGFRGYLKFGEKGKVELLSGDGYFQTKDIDSTLFNYKQIYSDETNYSLPNICEIWYPYEAELFWNKKAKTTNVKIIYPKE
ncbi:MAG: hypothetical protein V4548_10920 [Bacteroidota bacterium]